MNSLGVLFWLTYFYRSCTILSIMAARSRPSGVSNSSNRSGVRLAELMAALSLATDLGMGQPMEFALSSCVLAVRLAEKCGYSEEALREVYYQALLRYIGCNAETDWLASIVGDEQALRADFTQIDNGNASAVLSAF